MISEAAPEKRAPEPLRVVQQFVNSADLEEGKEDLETPAALGEWVRASNSRAALCAQGPEAARR